MEGENRLYTVLAVAGGFFCLAASIFFQSAIAVAVSGILFFLSLALWRYGYLIVPVLMRGAKVVEIGKNFEIPPSQDVIVGRDAGSFFATTFLCAKLRDAGERGERERARMGEMFENAVISAAFPFKICCLISPLDMKSELDDMRTKRSIAESRLGALKRGGKNEPEAARLTREVVMWGRQIERLSSGERPLELIIYLSTTAQGLSKSEAVARSRAQADELSAVVGGALSCDVVKLAGEDMKRCFWWDFFGPADREDLRDSLF